MTLPRREILRVCIGFRRIRNKHPPGGSMTLPYSIKQICSININLPRVWFSSQFYKHGQTDFHTVFRHSAVHGENLHAGS